MKRKKGDLLLSWQKKPVGLYLGDYSYYSFKDSKVCFYGQTNIRKKAFKALFYTEDGLEGANLKFADLSGADLSDTNLRGANLTGADLRFADLSGADLGGANLKGAVLYDANLYDAHLQGADLTNIQYDETTVWPQGFKPWPRFQTLTIA